MSRVDEFDSFYRSAFESVQHVTYALCGDRNVAHEATVDAFRRAWRDWGKIRERDPLAHVRSEAWRATALSRGTHPLRRRHEEDSDVELLDALSSLPSDPRRLIVLMTLGNTDLEEASREVGLPAEDGIEQATDALAALEQRLGQQIDGIETRLHGLASATAGLDVPAPAALRSAARRGTQRNTVLLVAAAVVGMLLAGLATVPGGDALARQSALPDRQRLGAETSDIVLDARRISDGELLDVDQVSRLDQSLAWKIEATDSDPDNTTPYATCPTKRFADPDPLRVLVRTFNAPDSDVRVAQSIEVSRSRDAAAEARRTIVRWFADCTHPRMQLTGSYRAERETGDFTILRLRIQGSPGRTFTVGVARSGSLTSTLVSEVDGSEGPDVEDFARTVAASVDNLCDESGGACEPDAEPTVTSVAPPRTSEAPAFLGIVDLPPIGNLARVWAAAEAKTDPNPAATPCDKSEVDGRDVRKSASRIYVLYQATEVPREFGVTETIARFGSAKQAQAFVDRSRDRMKTCADDNLSVDIDQSAEIDGGAGTSWRIKVEVNKSSTATYRVGVIRRGSDVAQVTFVTTDKFDVAPKTFDQLVLRAGTRLSYADRQFG